MKRTLLPKFRLPLQYFLYCLTARRGSDRKDIHTKASVRLSNILFVLADDPAPHEPYNVVAKFPEAVA